MIVTAGRLRGVLSLKLDVHADARGCFFEALSTRQFESLTGIAFRVAQANVSVSVRGTIRGVHFAEVPPGQAKFVQVIDGSILDVVVDLRRGSETYGQIEVFELSSESRNALFIPIGFGHGFQALSPFATVMYFCDQPYDPAREHAINPFDQALAIPWKAVEPVVSAKDASAPTLEEVVVAGLLTELSELRP